MLLKLLFADTTKDGIQTALARRPDTRGKQKQSKKVEGKGNKALEDDFSY